MGTDIHCHVELRTAGRWEPCKAEHTCSDTLPDIDTIADQIGRNYALFAILADVGRRTNCGFTPIVPPRGFPVDSPVVGKLARQSENYSSHNRTWLTVRELLDFPWHEKTVEESGYVDVENFFYFRIEGRPQYAHFDRPPDFLVVSNDEMERLVNLGADHPKLMTLISWGVPYAEFVDSFLTETLPLLCSLGEPSDVRLILSFGS